MNATTNTTPAQIASAAVKYAADESVSLWDLADLLDDAIAQDDRTMTAVYRAARTIRLDAAKAIKSDIHTRWI